MVRNREQNRITFSFSNFWKKRYGLDYINTHHCTFIHLIKDYPSFLPHPKLYYDSKSISKKFEYSHTLFNIPTRHPIGLSFQYECFNSYESTNMLTEVALPRENIQMSFSIKLKNISACSCLTCTWVSFTTGHPFSMFPYRSIIFLLKKYQTSEMKANHCTKTVFEGI